MAPRTGGVDAIDRHGQVRKVAWPDHESDHVLGIADHVRCGGTGMHDIEQRRQDEVDREARGAPRIPHPTTAGECGRRCAEADIAAWRTTINETRVRVGRAPPAALFPEAIIDADGTLAATTGPGKEGMDIADTGVWGAPVGGVATPGSGASPSAAGVRRPPRPGERGPEARNRRTRMWRIP